MTFELAEDDAVLERRLRIFGVPVALGLAFLLCAFGARFLLRLFFGMWVHELGHATAAWLCGYLAFPGPWLTPMSAERSHLFSLVLLVALIFGAVAKPALRWVFIGLIGLQIVCTGVLSESAAHQLVLFMGDGGCLLLGTLLMLTLYVRPGSALHKGWLRWGFLVIGAAAFADVFSLWWGARTDPDLIPFGMNEGVGLSDPSALSDTYGWSAGVLVHRYVVLGSVCLLVLLSSSLLSLRNRAARGE
ncbi:MAG TPA: hypothetical protein VH083_07120 [Myxococcales bacterium]|nr:hypothetical protein [Myxococcales bacterium]